MTACVRDLHRCYPGAYQTDIRSSTPGLWENNPYITPMQEDDPDVRVIEMNYPLIHKCNENSKHFLFGYIEYLNDILGLKIVPTEFRGDIHLTGEEKGWMSQVEETGHSGPFWIVNAGGKVDYTIKWWSAERYQEVVNYFNGKIQFVQVGEGGHQHPPLENVIDLRGKTDTRQLIRLVYHSQGCLSPNSFLMHLAAAVPMKEAVPLNRPCVVVAGGREPPHWAAYPHHQFMHTVGALRCCDNGGCWKARTFALGDGTAQDAKNNLCVNTVPDPSSKTQILPKCMDMISAENVQERIQMYFEGGIISYMSNASMPNASDSVKTETRIFDHAPSIGLVIGCFAALPYIHVGLESRKRLYPDVPLLVSDDLSPNAGALEELCKSYGADFITSSIRQNPCVGDMAAYVNGLKWAKEKNLDILVKMSRRFIPKVNWVPELQSLAMESQYPTYSQQCIHYNFGFRTECFGMHVNSWSGAALDNIRREVEANNSVFVEKFMHDCARSLAESACEACQTYQRSNSKPEHINGYATWNFMPPSRIKTSTNYLWHDSHSRFDYYKLSQEYGLPYTEEDFADPNRG